MSGSLALKYLLIFSLAIVLLCSEVFGQQEVNTPQDSKHVNFLDMQFLGVGLGYKGRITKRIFLGVQAGGGSLLGKWIEAPPFTADDVWMVQRLRGGLYLHLVLGGWEMELGVNGFIFVADPSFNGKSVSFGIFKKLGKKLQIGTRVDSGKDERDKSLAFSSLIILRKNINMSQ